MWPIKNFWNYFMAHQYMSKIFHDPHKIPPASPPTYLMYGPLWSSCNFSGYWTLISKVYFFEENMLYHFLRYNSLENLHKMNLCRLISIIDPFKFIYWKLWWHFPTIQFFYIPIFKIWWFFIFIIIFQYLLLAFWYRWIAWHIPLLISFPIIISISMLVNNLDFTFSLF